MAKAGDEYQDIVGAVAKALDPGATVKVGQWLVGPDCRRDLDVEVRGTIEGRPYFVQIECKDWADVVGIAVVDALDSKRRDLGADLSIIYSNSGFTEPALRKAARVGIEMASALKANDNRIKVVVEKRLVAKRLSVDNMSAVLYPPPRNLHEVPEKWSIDDLRCDDLPARNWIAALSRRLLQEHESANFLTFRCTLKSHPHWTYAGKPIAVAALAFKFQISRTWVSQTVREDVTLGYYDHLRRSVTVPNGQGYWLGWIDREAWIPSDEEPDEAVPAPNSFALSLTLLNPIHETEGESAPRVDELILEQDVVPE